MPAEGWGIRRFKNVEWTCEGIEWQSRIARAQACVHALANLRTSSQILDMRVTSVGRARVCLKEAGTTRHESWCLAVRERVQISTQRTLRSPLSFRFVSVELDLSLTTDSCSLVTHTVRAAWPQACGITRL